MEASFYCEMDMQFELSLETRPAASPVFLYVLILESSHGSRNSG